MNTIKKGIVLLGLILSCTAPQAQGIHFETGDWASIQKKAKASNKLIFVDVFTTWCGPCKKMDKMVFTNKDLGTYFNKHFISYKLDAEKGEGITLSKVYGVASYPNLMFIDSIGKLVVRGGYMKADQLLEFAYKAERSEKDMAAITSAYYTGNRTPEFMVKYLAFLKERDLPTEDIITQYLEGIEQQQWLTLENLKLIRAYIHSFNNPVIDYLEDCAVLANTRIDQQQWIRSILDGIYMQYLKKIIQERKAPKDIDKLLSSYSKLGFGSKSTAYFYFIAKRLTTKRDGDWDRYVEHTIGYVNTYLLDKSLALNNYAWGFYKNDNITDPKVLNIALGWVNRALRIRMDFNFMDTKAALLYKLKRKEEALIVANKAIKLAAQNGDDPSETLKLIKKVKML